jgi:DNA repair protein RadC
MPDYELLELVLFRAIPRQDVKPLARLLLDTFGDFNRVISAAPARLMLVKGVGESVVQELKIVEAASQRMMRAKVMQPAGAVVVGARFWTIATPPWRTAKPNSSASFSLTARTC